MTALIRSFALALLAAALVAGCGLLPDAGKDETAGWSADRLYRAAHDSLVEGNYTRAVKLFETLESRFPYGRYAQQAMLESAYASYRGGETSTAIQTLDRFIRTYPNHPNVDYAYYLKGLVYFEFDRNFLEKLFRVDLCERPPNEAYKAFSNFSQLVQRYPNSPYSADAHQRMVFLRNCFASYETNVAKYYVERGAWVAAANRAKYAVETYPATPSTRDALETMAFSYRKLGMDDLATDSERVLAETYDITLPAQARAEDLKPAPEPPQDLTAQSDNPT